MDFNDLRNKFNNMSSRNNSHTDPESIHEIRNEVIANNQEENLDGSVEEETNENDDEISQNNDQEPNVFVTDTINGDVNADGFLSAKPKVSNEDFNEYGVKSVDENPFPPITPINNECYNYRALLKHDRTYKLETFEKKVLVIFNQENVEGYLPRLGTEKDVEAMTKTFENVGFDVVVHNDFKKSQIFKELKSFFSQNFTDYGCVAIAVLTHGNENGMLRAKDRSYNESEITRYLETSMNPTLLTKPKLLIVQACRGTTTNYAVTVRAQSGSTHKDHYDDEYYTMPEEADQLILHSTYAGNPSFRNINEGSWLIQSLCKHIDELASTTDFESILTEVKKEVAIDRCHEEYNRRTNHQELNKQIPVMTSTLIRKLYLKKFGDVTHHDAAVDMPTEHIPSASHDDHDASRSMPATPSIIESSRTDMSRDYYCYIIDCLRFYIEDNPEDSIAQSFLDLSTTFGEGHKFESSKNKMIDVLCHYFNSNEDKIKFFKYIFLMKTQCFF